MIAQIRVIRIDAEAMAQLDVRCPQFREPAIKVVLTHGTSRWRDCDVG
jgi:hypothetical protein